MLPGPNVVTTLERTIAAIPRGFVDQLIFVDDGGSDGSAELGRRLGCHVFRHPKNRGYGAAQKTGYREALRLGADVLVMVHPDFHYKPELVPAIASMVAFGGCDVVLGSRLLTRGALPGGMPLWKYMVHSPRLPDRRGQRPRALLRRAAYEHADSLAQVRPRLREDRVDDARAPRGLGPLSALRPRRAQALRLDRRAPLHRLHPVLSASAPSGAVEKPTRAQLGGGAARLRARPALKPRAAPPARAPAALARASSRSPSRSAARARD